MNVNVKWNFFLDINRISTPTVAFVEQFILLILFNTQYNLKCCYVMKEKFISNLPIPIHVVTQEGRILFSCAENIPKDSILDFSACG